MSDSSTLILMAKITLLKTFLERNEVIVPIRVYEETVRKGMAKGERDAYLINEQVESGKIEIQEADREVKKKVKEMFGIAKGENEVISMAMQKKPELILTDDRKCIHVCSALDLEFSTCIDVVVCLYKKGRIGKRKALDCMENLKEFGWYSREIMDSRIKEIGGE